MLRRPQSREPAGTLRAGQQRRMKGFLYKAYRMYVDGFRQMTVGRKLWLLIIIKLAILFLVFRLFFFPDILQENYSTDAERAEAVRTALTDR